jgi:hypothetical protein
MRTPSVVVNGMTMGDLYQRTMKKKRYLQGQEYIYVGKWECEFDREVRENDTLRNFVQQSEMINPLEPRDGKQQFVVHFYW